MEIYSQVEKITESTGKKAMFFGYLKRLDPNRLTKQIFESLIGVFKQT